MVEGARATLKFAQISLYTHSPSVSRSRASSLSEGAFYKFIVGEGSPLPKRDRILCFIHGRRNASPTRQIFVSSYAIGVCGNGFSRHNGRGSSRTAGARRKRRITPMEDVRTSCALLCLCVGKRHIHCYFVKPTHKKGLPQAFVP